jgi:hypothetical protein
MPDKHYILSPKRGSNPPPENWHQKLAAIEGVSLLGATPHQAQFLADATSVEKVRSEFGASYHLEEVATRGPQEA